MDEKEVAPTLANGLPQPPMPQRLRELLKDYPEYLEKLQADLNLVVEHPFKATPLFEQAVWALEDGTSAFIREAQAELERALASGDPTAIVKAEEKASLMRRSASANDGLKGLHDLWDFFELHAKAIR